MNNTKILTHYAIITITVHIVIPKVAMENYEILLMFIGYTKFLTIKQFALSVLR